MKVKTIRKNNLQLNKNYSGMLARKYYIPS